jgi:hypothetical protein
MENAEQNLMNFSGVLCISYFSVLVKYIYTYHFTPNIFLIG